MSAGDGVGAGVNAVSGLVGHRPTVFISRFAGFGVIFANLKLVENLGFRL